MYVLSRLAIHTQYVADQLALQSSNIMFGHGEVFKVQLPGSGKSMLGYLVWNVPSD